MELDTNIIINEKIRMIADEVSESVHDFKTPLQHLLFTITSILNGNSGTFDQEVKEDLDEMKLSIEKAFLLIDSKLQNIDYASDRTAAVFELNDISKPIKEAINRLKPLAKAKRIKVIDNISEKFAILKIDYSKIRSAITNIINNSIKYTSEDGIILIQSYTSDSAIQIIIADNGPGISKCEQDRIFERFSPKSERRNNISSSGIGLNISFNYLALHNFTLKVTSPLDKKIFKDLNLNSQRVGTAFSVDIPIYNS